MIIEDEEYIIRFIVFSGGIILWAIYTEKLFAKRKLKR